MNVTHPLISEMISGSREALLRHKLYQQLRTIEHLHIFMQYHVFAVWDFMSLLKALQQKLTCVETPWLPTGDPRVRRLVNEIVLGEESDVTGDGEAISHFELYLRAMDEAGANIQPINCFIDHLRDGASVDIALDLAAAPDCVKEFVSYTFQVLINGQLHEIAAAFTYGREDLIPAMFSELVAQLQNEFPGRLDTFRYYLNRHIELDGDEHGEWGRAMVDLLCGGNVQKQSQAAAAAKQALQARIALWEGIAEVIANHHEQ